MCPQAAHRRRWNHQPSTRQTLRAPGAARRRARVELGQRRSCRIMTPGRVSSDRERRQLAGQLAAHLRLQPGAVGSVLLGQHLAVAMHPADQVARGRRARSTSTRTCGRGSDCATSSASSSSPSPVRAETTIAARLAPPQPVEHLGVGQVGLVDHDDLAQVLGADLAEHLADGGQLALGVGVRAVDDVQQQVGVGDLLQRRAEGLDQLVRQRPDEADGVGQGVQPAVGGARPGARSGRGWRTARPRPAPRRRSAG